MSHDANGRERNGRERVVITYQRHGDGAPHRAWVPAAGRDALQQQGRLLRDHGEESLYVAQSGVRIGIEQERCVAMLTAAERGSAELAERGI